jgi:hypothetical protein
MKVMGVQKLREELRDYIAEDSVTAARKVKEGLIIIHAIFTILLSLIA